MRGDGPQPSRTSDDLRLKDAATLTAAVGISLEAGAVVTISWDRRRLLDTALTLALISRQHR